MIAQLREQVGHGKRIWANVAMPEPAGPAARGGGSAAASLARALAGPGPVPATARRSRSRGTPGPAESRADSRHCRAQGPCLTVVITSLSQRDSETPPPPPVTVP